jgi:hypothetical protein
VITTSTNLQPLLHDFCVTQALGQLGVLHMRVVQNRYLTGLALLGLFAGSTACLDKASKQNDSAASETKSAAMMSSDGSARAASGNSAVNAGASGAAGTTRAAGAAGATAPATNTATATTPMTAGTGATAPNTNMTPAAGNDGEDAGVTPPPTGNAAGAGAEGAAGSGPATGEAGAPGTTEPTGPIAPNPALVAGTGTSCASYATPANGKCGSYYCNVDLPTLTMAIDPATACGKDPEFTCNGNLVIAVGTCARQVKSENLLDSNDALRPKVEACVYEDPVIKQKVAPECLGCFIGAAICAGDNCLTQCLAGDSPGCDACRKQANCEAPVFTCGGLPTPF